jgi:hypothetical protein
VRRLKDARGDAVRVWPFETGFKALTEADLEGVAVVVRRGLSVADQAGPRAGEVKDLAQVRTLAEHFAKLDEAGKLARCSARRRGFRKRRLRRPRPKRAGSWGPDAFSPCGRRWLAKRDG